MSKKKHKAQRGEVAALYERMKACEHEAKEYWDRYQYLQRKVEGLVQILDFDDRRVAGALHITKKEVLASMQTWLKNLDKACLDNCKDMYFCDKKRGHRGQHRDSCGLSKGGLVWDGWDGL